MGAVKVFNGTDILVFGLNKIEQGHATRRTSWKPDPSATTKGERLMTVQKDVQRRNQQEQLTPLVNLLYLVNLSQ